MRHIRLTLLFLSVAAVVSSGVMIQYESYNPGPNNGYAAASEAGVSYTIGNFSLSVFHNETVRISSDGVTISINPTVYDATSGKFVSESFVSGKINRIDNSYQNTVALVDHYSGTQVTYIYDAQGGKLSLTLVSSSGSPCVSLNISGPAAISASGSAMFFGGFNAGSYGTYVMGNNYSSFYESFQLGSLSLSWFQFTAIHQFDYGIFSLNRDSTSLSLMFGPLYSNGVTLNSGPLTVSMY